MNGTQPKFWEDTNPENTYYEKPDPYKNAPSCNVNLPELSRYAKRTGKRVHFFCSLFEIFPSKITDVFRSFSSLLNSNSLAGTSYP